MFQDTINIKIVNNAGVTKTYSVFGYNNNGVPTPGALVAINATPNSLAFAVRESQSNPYVTRRMRLICSNTAQWGNSIQLQGIRGSSLDQWSINPIDSQPPSNRLSTTIDLAIPPFVIGPTLALAGDIEAGTTLNIVIAYNHLYDKPSNLVSYINGQPPLILHNYPSNRIIKG